jgi:V/A-type H+-transporting ATPase subunit E
MSLDSILNKITHQANLEGKKIIQEARKEAEGLIQQANEEAAGIYRQILGKEKSLYEARKMMLLVNARLESKKSLLKAKQDLIAEIFERLKSEIPKGKIKEEHVLQNKTEEVSEDIDFYLDNLRYEHETEIARILFG